MQDGGGPRRPGRREEQTVPVLLFVLLLFFQHGVDSVLGEEWEVPEGGVAMTGRPRAAKVCESSAAVSANADAAVRGIRRVMRTIQNFFIVGQ